MKYQYTIDINEINQIVMVESSGVISNKEAEAMYIEVFDLFNRLDMCRVLIDSRQVKLAETPLSIMKFISHFKDQQMFDGIRVARVVRLDSYNHEFVEQVANFNNVQIRNFEEVEQAVSWLKAGGKCDR